MQILDTRFWMLVRGIKILFILFLCLLSSIKHPASSIPGTGAGFLKLGVGARALGMGSAYTAVADDVTALHWNPAGLSQIRKREVGAMHAQLFADSRFNFIGYAHPVKVATNSQGKVIATESKGKTVLGISAVYLNQGSLEGRSADRTQTTDFSASDLAVTLGVARSDVHLPLTTYPLPLSLGLNLKLLQSKISGYSSTGFAFDVGSLINLSSLSSLSAYHLPLTVGFAVQNIGPQMKYLNESYNLPLTFAGGVHLPLIAYHLPLIFSADLKHRPYESQTTFGIGTEFSPVSILSLRAGYLLGKDDGSAIRYSAKSGVESQLANLTGLGLGIGFKLSSINIDYSFSPSSDLGNTQRLSLALRF